MINKTILPPPPPLHLGADPQKYWNFKVQNLAPLVTVDTSQGNETQSPPPAGVNASTGQTNQNQEITYIKVSNDGNIFTLKGVEGGPYMLTAYRDVIRIKSDGTNWWPVG
jgi:hypothetical protein